MEVHHHPEIPHGEKKNFREYLLEGLMIFLAVFMGFIAENIREHISDNSKERIYLKSLFIDLKQDSAKLSEIIRIGDRLKTGQDSLLVVLADTKMLKLSSDKAYQLFFKYGTSMPEFNSTDRTLSQLTNSGNFRVIENQELADSISNYYDKVKDTGLQTNVDNTSAMDCFQFAQNIFKLEYGLHPLKANKTLITYDPIVIEKYRNKLTQMRITQQYYIQADLQELYKNCLQLLQMLKKHD
jgi:hypothetical protein